MLDARIVAANMYQRNALIPKELQSIQSLRDRPVEAAETLLDIIVEQPDAVYLCFLDVLKQTEQQRHIYQRLVEDTYKGQWTIFTTADRRGYNIGLLISTLCLLAYFLKCRTHSSDQHLVSQKVNGLNCK